MILPKLEIEQAFKRLEAAARPTIAIHQHPDGDTLGAGLGLAHVLWEQGKDAQIFCRTQPGKQFQYLAGFERVESDVNQFLSRQPDVLVVLDSGDMVYCGVADLVEQLTTRPFIINIDHHATNTQFGDINIVSAETSSTAELLYTCLRLAGRKIPRPAANCFLTGLMTDTGVFSNLATTTGSLLAAADLVSAGGKPQTVIRHNYRNRNLNTMRLWGEAFQRLRKHKTLGWVVTVITQADLKKYGASEEDTEGITNFLNSLADAEALMLLVERADGTIKASLRTTRPNVDVSRIAKLFGGGGHVKAAGFTIPGRLLRSGDSWKIVSSNSEHA